MIINKQRLKQTLAKQVPAAISKQVFNDLEKEFEKAKAKLLRDFETHAVTQELDGRNSSSNISRTLDGEGNLYSFIGFAGEDALASLRELLNDIKMELNMYVQSTNKFRHDYKPSY